MINYCNKKEDIVSVWSEVFKDTEEEILFFIDNLQHGKCIAYYLDDKVVSMLYLVDCRINNRVSRYIYAACTSKDFEGRGFITELINYASEIDSTCLCLIPANESLIDFYGQRGFNHTESIDLLEFDETDEIKEYLFEGFELDKPIVMIKE